MSNTNDPVADKFDVAEKAETSGGVPAIDRALNVLECLSQSRKGYSVSELSRRLGLPKSSVHLILRTLERRGYLQKQSAGGRYKFGMKLIALSRAALDGVELRDEARPALAALAQRTGLTVHMGVLERSEIVIIERLESPSPIRVVSWIGRRMDLNSTAVGKALIAHLPEAEFEAQVRPSQLGRHNDRTIGSMTALRKELERVRQLGYAVCDEEDEIGVRCVGAPIVNRHGHSIAAVSVAGTTLQIPTERLGELGQAVREAAAEISARFQRASN
jgi:DNA-binding IclR family transcriptional regulator